jgi:hypothetical protein
VTGPLQEIATDPVQEIATAPLRATVIGPPYEIAIDPAQLIEIGRKLATPAVAKMQAKAGPARRARNRPRRLVRRQRRQSGNSRAKGRASGQASRGVTPLFPRCNQALGLTPKPVAAVKVLAVVEERPA